MWNGLFDAMLAKFLRHGSLIIIMPDGTRRTYGDGTGTPVTVRFTEPDLARRIILNPEVAVGEAYMDGTMTIDDDDLRGFLAMIVANAAESGGVWWQKPIDRVRKALRWSKQFNPMGRARANVAHHYDLSAELYDLFLDADKQYSCAYFTHPGATLDEAQAAKKAHIAGKLMIEPGMRVLDIGCGWGGMALTLARDYGARVIGVTLSEEQHKIATARAAEAGLSDQVEFRLTDYRRVTETFDRIVSVGMFEHVGVPHYREYFHNVSDRLSPDGIALIHTIGRMRPPGTTSPWIEKYIFPGGYVPALSEMTAALEKEHLYATDVEIWRLHYAETLRQWSERFEANIDAARKLYDERFCRMWRYYLIICEMTFRHGRQAVFQVQLAHRQDAVPLTRDYLYPNAQEGLRNAAE
ncbi:MAG: class I SAM-dependent methyltransferase [Rhodobacteraceae bacterium]|nr:class I SAM-dependent methyltransferase [Paracoccaceae bacterium]